MSDDNPIPSGFDKQKTLKDFAILQWAMIDMLKEGQMDEKVRAMGIKSLDKIGFFDELNGGEMLRERWSKNPIRRGFKYNWGKFVSDLRLPLYPLRPL